MIYYEKMWAFRDWWHREPIIIWREKTPIISREQENSLDDTLSPSERDQILKDLFEWKEWSVDSSFLYKWKWAELYERISKDESYPFIEIENESLEELRYNGKFVKILSNTDYITDVWCGDWQKIIAMLWTGGPYKDRPFVVWDGTYIPEDYSWQMLDIAVENIKKRLHHVKIWDSVKLNSGKHLSKDFSKNMYLFLWGTICNMSDEEIVHELMNMDNNWVIIWNHILLSYFTAPNTQEEIDELIKIYNSESNRLFHENGMAMLWLSKDDFEFDTIYEKDNPEQTSWPFPWKIKWIIRAKRDCVVKLNNWREISIKKWQEFTIHYSRRFTKKWIEQLFKKSWCKVVFTIDKKWDSIALLRKKPARLKKVRQTLRNALIWTLVAGSLATGISSHYENERQKEKEREYTEWESWQTRWNEWENYSQEIKELTIALQLNKLNKKDKQIVIDMFNDYVSDNKSDWTTTEELIQWFWKKYGWILIKNFDIKHPYYSITPEMITNTNNLDEEISYTPERESNGRIKSNRIHGVYWIYYPDIEFIQWRWKSRVLEYNDWWEKYFVMKLRIYISDEETEIYVAVKGNDINYSCPPYSTDVINDIKDTSWLDPVILSNTKKLGWPFVLHGVNRFGTTLGNNWPILTYSDDNKIVDMSALRESRIKPIAVYLWEWKMYYIITVPTQWWGKIWLASDTIDWTYTTTLFNEISEEFSRARILF